MEHGSQLQLTAEAATNIYFSKSCNQLAALIPMVYLHYVQADSYVPSVETLLQSSVEGPQWMPSKQGARPSVLTVRSVK